MSHLWNLHEDTQLTGTLIHFLHPGLNYVGRKTGDTYDDPPDINLPGLRQVQILKFMMLYLHEYSIRSGHAVIINEDKETVVSLSPHSSAARILVNGQPISSTVILHHNDR